MIVLDYSPLRHPEIIKACIRALKQGKVIAYPTDTSYGLACDPGNNKGLSKFYKIKERTRNKPVHVIVPSLAYAKKVAAWSGAASKLAKKFWPGPLSLVLPLKSQLAYLKIFSAKTGTIGLRMPKNKIALDLAKYLGRPITATSANPAAHLSGGYDSYSAQDIVDQFRHQRHKPDIIINAGTLPKRKPSTLVKVVNEKIEILRPGPITKKQIFNDI